MATAISRGYSTLSAIRDIVCRSAASVVDGGLRKRVIVRFVLFDGRIFFLFIIAMPIRLRIDLRILRLIANFCILRAMVVERGELGRVERGIGLGKRDRARAHDARNRHRYRRRRNAFLRCAARSEFRCLLHMLRHNNHL